MIDKTIRDQMRNVKDLYFISILLFSTLLCLFLLSFIVQNVATSERSAGRDIHTYQYQMTVVIMKLQFDVESMLQNKRVIDFNDNAKYFITCHTYLKNNSINENAYAIFISGEQIYGNILSNIINVQLKKNVQQSLLLLFSEFNEYRGKISTMYDMYTGLFVQSNYFSQLCEVINIVFGTILILILSLFIYFPTIKRLKSSYILINVPEIAKEIEEQIIFDDVKEIHKDMYSVKNYKGNPYIVTLQDGRFICNCRMYRNTGNCFHSMRARRFHIERIQSL